MTETLGFESLRSRLRFQGDLITRTGLRIGVGRDTDVAGRDLPVIRDAGGRPFIPGSSFKGVLRASVESMLRGLSDSSDTQRQKLACYVLERDGRCISYETINRWREIIRAPQKIAEQVLELSCLVCRTFGSTWLASHVAVRDLTVAPALWFGQFEVRQGVSLDRDTETAREGQLYSFETVPPGTRFTLEIEADNLLPWQRGLLLLGLQPFLRGEGGLGGARSRGLGQVELQERVPYSWSGWELSEPRATSVIAFLQGGLQPVAEATRATWRHALLAKLEEVAHV